MRNQPVTRASRAARRLALPLMAALVVTVPACTDLGESPVSSITPDNFYQNEEEVLGGLAAVYAGLRGTIWGYYNLSEISSDEIIVPTRGSDWYDNGKWLELHRHTWAPTSAAGLDDINGGWNDPWVGIARANVLLEALQNVEVTDKAIVEAEVRTLRAFYYYALMDLFGGLPIATESAIMPRERATRAATFDFIESELLATRAVLPDAWPDAMHGRMTSGAANAILASMYLNAEVFTGEVTAAGLTRGDARWQDAYDTAMLLINSPEYDLATDWFSNFTADNNLSPEIIMSVKYVAEEGIGFEMIYRGLHYNQATPAPWNGFATIAETYYAFDTNTVTAQGILISDDIRHQIFLAGLQSNVETGEPVEDRSGAPLFFTPTIGDEDAASEGEGVRIYKWPADPNRVGQWHGNDYGYFRLAEMYLIAAEATNELGDPDEALTLVNQVRARAFEPDDPIVGPLTQAEMRVVIQKERLFELTAEAKRRQDLIRYGMFTDEWSFKPESEPYRILFPIPQPQMDANPLLVQNPGY